MEFLRLQVVEQQHIIDDLSKVLLQLLLLLLLLQLYLQCDFSMQEELLKYFVGLVILLFSQDVQNTLFEIKLCCCFFRLWRQLVM